MKAILGDAPDIVFEHVGKATFPTSVFVVKPFGKVVICGATSGFDLDFDVRYLWMRQKQIIGSHFANAWEANKANELIEQGKIRPVLWQTMPFDDVADAHQLLRENKHLGKIAILVGADRRGPGQDRRGPGRHPRGGRHLMAGADTPGIVLLPWYATGLRADRLEPALARIAAVALRYGATKYELYRSQDDRYRFRHYTYFNSKKDFERYWYGPEMVQFRADYSSWYQVPIVYEWFELVASDELANGNGEPEPEPVPEPAVPAESA